MEYSSFQAGPPAYSLGLTYDNPVNPDHLRLRRQSELSYVSWYIRQGKAVLETPDGRQEALAGQWVFFDPLTEHSHWMKQGTVLISIRFRILWRGLDYLPPLMPIRVVSSDKPELLAAAQALCQANATEHPATSAEYFHREALFYLWLEQWRCERESLGILPEAPSDPRVYSIMQTLSENITIEPIDYPALQRKVGLSRAQINRIFTKSAGLTPRQWMVARCLDEAQRQIRHGERSLKEIAASLGFFDASHFTRWHRNQTGQSPTDWKQHQAF